MDGKEIERDKYSNYSKEDGEMLTSIDYMDVTLEKDTGDFCKICGEESSIKYNYCKKCGAQLYESSRFNGEEGEDKYRIASKGILLTSLGGVMILLLVATVYKSIIFKDLLEVSSSINPLHILLSMNLGIIDIYSSSMISSQSITVKLGVIILIIWPVIALAISNLIFMKEYSKNIKSIITNSIGVGLTYGLILGIISIVSRVVGNSYGMFNYGYSMVYGFRPFSLVLNGFIIGFLCTFELAIMKNNKVKNKCMDIFKIGIKTVAIGYMLVFLLLIILNLSNNSYLHELGLYKYLGSVSIGLILSQLSAYLWAFANLIPVTIGSSSISIFSIASSSLFLDTKLIFMAMVALSSLIMLLVGIKLKNKYKEDSINPVLVFSIIYSLSMGILGTFTSIIVYSNTISIAMGFDAILAMVISFVYSFTFALIGYKLS